MSLIEDIITKQGFEIVRDLIGSILFIELTNQKTLQGFDDPINVYIGRSSPFQQSEKLMINVHLDSANYGSRNQRAVSGSTQYFIDIYSTGKETKDVLGGTDSSNRRDKFTGICRSILNDTHYKTLGLPPGNISSSGVEGFENFNIENDTAYVTMSRLTYSIKLNEKQSLWTGNEINAIFTQIKLELTEKGYKYITD